MATRYFTPRFFEFFEELSRNNNRDWFIANKPRYEHDVREPMLAFIADFAPRLRKISARYVADPSPTGGSMMRIYRNLRFSRDKTPYRTNAAAAFGHRDGMHFNSPSFYLSLSAAEAFAGVGVWHPQADTTAKIRDAIAARPSKWKAADRRSQIQVALRNDGRLAVAAAERLRSVTSNDRRSQAQGLHRRHRLHAQGSLLARLPEFIFHHLRRGGPHS